MFFAEIAALKKDLEEEYQAQLQDNAHAMEEMKKSFEQKLKESEANSSVSLHMPFIWLLNSFNLYAYGGYFGQYKIMQKT